MFFVSYHPWKELEWGEDDYYWHQVGWILSTSDEGYEYSTAMEGTEEEADRAARTAEGILRSGDLRILEEWGRRAIYGGIHSDEAEADMLALEEFHRYD